MKRIFTNNSNNSYRSKNKIDSTTKFLIWNITNKKIKSKKKRENGFFDFFYFILGILKYLYYCNNIILENHLEISHKFFSTGKIVLVAHSFSFLNGQSIRWNDSKHSFSFSNPVCIRMGSQFLLHSHIFDWNELELISNSLITWL